MCQDWVPGHEGEGQEQDLSLAAVIHCLISQPFHLLHSARTHIFPYNTELTVLTAHQAVTPTLQSPEGFMCSAMQKTRLCLKANSYISPRTGFLSLLLMGVP